MVRSATGDTNATAAKVIDTYHEREAALAQMDNRRVEVSSLMERRKDDRGRQGRRALCILTMVSLMYFYMVRDFVGM